MILAQCTLDFPQQERSSENTKSIKSLGGWGFVKTPLGELTAFPQAPLAGGEGTCSPFPKSQPFRASSFGPSSLTTEAPNLLLNQGPAQPCYATE